MAAGGGRGLVRGNSARSVIHDACSRGRKAAKILAILREACGPSLGAARCLDVGSASGLVLRWLAPHLGQAVGVEYDAQSVALVGREGARNLLFVRGDATHLPVRDNSVDLVLNTQVYEHVSDPDAMAAEIRRVLVPGGICFFSGPNKLALIEEHYGLPFVSLLPRRWADAWIRLAGRGDSYGERPRTYWGLRQMWQGFHCRDYTLEMIRDPDRYRCTEELGRLRWVGRLPTWLLRVLRPLYPNYNWVLRKK